MRVRAIKLLLVLVFLSAFLSSCATIGITTDFTKMTPKQKATYFMGVYNRQYASYKVDAAMPSLSADQKKVLVIRKDILTKVYPLISTYDLAVASGQSTTRAQEDAIMALLNQFATLLVK